MYWYLILTKPRQEKNALQNLEQQGYVCYLPTLSTEKIRQGVSAVVSEPLFPRYLFIKLDRENTSKGWAPIRSTKGVSRLVSFGNEPAKLSDHLVASLRAREEAALLQPQPFFSSGERVQLASGIFAGIEGIYREKDGESRVMILIEFLSKSAQLRVSPAILRKVG